MLPDTRNDFQTHLGGIAGLEGTCRQGTRHFFGGQCNGDTWAPCFSGKSVDFWWKQDLDTGETQGARSTADTVMRWKFQSLPCKSAVFRSHTILWFVNTALTCQMATLEISLSKRLFNNLPFTSRIDHEDDYSRLIFQETHLDFIVILPWVLSPLSNITTFTLRQYLAQRSSIWLIWYFEKKLLGANLNSNVPNNYISGISWKIGKLGNPGSIFLLGNHQMREKVVLSLGGTRVPLSPPSSSSALPPCNCL